MTTQTPFTLRGVIAIVGCCLLPATGLAANDPTQIRAIVDAEIRPLMAQHDVPGMAVAITIDGDTTFHNYGVASREHNTPVTDATLFELGSVSKTLAATLASYAQATGKLSLSDHPSKYMPQLKGSAIDKASLLHLGTYTAGGLPLQFPEGVTDERVGVYFHQWKAEAAPGTQRSYSNPSVGLFGHIAALALKRDFSDAVETLLFRKLGMDNSFIRMPPAAMANYAWGYNRANQPVRVNPGVMAAEAYGVKSSAADLIRFVQANIDPSRLAAPLRQAVAGTQVGYFKVGPMVQGLGWEQYAYPTSVEELLSGNSAEVIFDASPVQRVAPQAATGPVLFNKTGSTGGFGAYVLFVPAKKIGIVMLANKNYPIPARVSAAHGILQKLAQSQ